MAAQQEPQNMVPLIERLTQALVERLTQHPIDAEQVRSDFVALANVSRQTGNRIGIEGIAAVVFVMRMQPSNRLVQQSGCGLITCCEPANARVVAPEGVIDVILGIMRRFRGDHFLQGCGCAAIYRLCFPNVEYALKVARLGGVQMVIDAMQSGAIDENLQRIGCAALAALAKTTALQVEIEGRGGIQAVLAATQQHPTHTQVNQNAIIMIFNLSRNIESRHRMVELGIIQLAVEVMQAHPMQARLQTNGCRLLGNLAQVGGTTRVLVVDLGLEVLVAARDNHPRSKKIQSAFLSVIFGINKAFPDQMIAYLSEA
jgi:hypothetical protein